MITPMKKVFIATRARHREALLGALRGLGILHVAPVDPAASPPAELVEALSDTRRALQVIGRHEPSGRAPVLSPADAVAEILAIARRIDEHNSRLTSLHREAGQLTWWGDTKLSDLGALSEAGVHWGNSIATGLSSLWVDVRHFHRARRILLQEKRRLDLEDLSVWQPGESEAAPADVAPSRNGDATENERE